ncbi:MAG: HEAT repeat domain-containing protein [Coleofasciculus sp. S288]|nr:HEAT repeat domain-containing protein [Coleofasciculus sp. S288]
MATNQQNWTLVNQCLQQLPLEKKGATSPSLNEPELQQILNLAVKVLVESDFQERWEVAKLFPKLGERAIAPLIEILEDEDADLELRWYAARILGEFQHPQVVTALVELLQNAEDEDLAEMAAAALANLGSFAIDALTPLLAEEDTRFLAVQALTHIRRVETIAPLLSVVDDPQVSIRAAVIEAISSFHDFRIPPVLVKALNDLAARVRKEAIIGLSLRPDLRDELDLVNRIKPLLWDFNGEVCQQAAIALGRLGTDDAAEALFQVLKSPATPLPLQITVVRALGWMETLDAVDYLQQGLTFTSVAACQEIVSVLGRLSEPSLRPKAAKILIDFLNSGQEAVREMGVKQALAIALGQLGDGRAQKVLIEMLAEEDTGVRLHAIAALKQFPEAYPQLQQLATDEQLVPALKEGVAIALAEWQGAEDGSR